MPHLPDSSPSVAFAALVTALAMGLPFGCGNGQSAPPADTSCSDGETDGQETGVDCGGPLCAPCGDRQRCLANSDCQDGRCVNSYCGGPFCDDGTQNGGETDIDCGGPVCLPCGTNHSCLQNRDCAGALCVADLCALSCPDGALDGNETDLDCGGANCPGCATGQRCESDSDCAAGRCVASLCAPKTTLTFQSAKSFYTALGTRELRTGDLDGDGYPDLAFAAVPDGTPAIGVMVSRFPADSLAPPSLTSDDLNPSDHHLIAFTDLDGDGHADALSLVSASDAWLAELLRANGLTLNAPRYAASCATPAAAVGDYDGDHIPDLVTAGATLQLCLGDGNGAFNCTTTMSLPGIDPVARVALADVDGDQQTDIVLAHQSGSLSLLLGHGSAAPSAPVGIVTASSSSPTTYDLALTDLDGDGHIDYLWTHQGDDGVWIALGLANAKASTPTLLPTSAPRTLALADFDGDGALDIAAGSATQIALFAGRKDGTFDPAVSLSAGPTPSDIATADFDLDGRPDLVAGDSAAGRVWLLMNATR